ncbi:MAG TPA: hypothetical protein VIJ79_03480 [Acidobacteriaceae bacterium]
MPDEQDGNARLDSWKTIAAYLGRDVRTVIRWEQTRGLPIRRMPGDSRSGVYAFKSEIDGWLKGQSALPTTEQDENPTETIAAVANPHKSSRTFPRGMAVAAISLLAVLALGWVGYRYAHREAPQPVGVTFTPTSLQAWDENHHQLWEYRFPQPLIDMGKMGDLDQHGSRMGDEDIDRASFHDLYGDGRREILAVVHFQRGDSLADHARQVLLCLSPEGKLLWRYEPQTVLTFGSRTYRAPWVLRDWIVSDGPGRKTIWVVATDYIWGKSFIARLDADGHATTQFVNSGEIAVLQRFHTPQGPMLWIGGFNDEYDTASLAIMRDTQTYAVSPQTPGSHFACQGCEKGDPFAYFVFPRYEMGRVLHNPNNRVFAITSDATQIEVRQAEISEDDQIIYDFSNDGDPKPVRVNYSSSFWPNHFDLERQGKVNHPLAECPDRLHPPPVRVYQNGKWSDIAVSSTFSK